MSRKYVVRIAAGLGAAAALFLAFTVIAEWARFDGTCRTMGFPFLAASEIRE